MGTSWNISVLFLKSMWLFLAICFEDILLEMNELRLLQEGDWVEVMGQQTCPADRNDLSPFEVTTWAQEMSRTLENCTHMNKNKGRFNPWDFLKGQNAA